MISCHLKNAVIWSLTICTYVVTDPTRGADQVTRVSDGAIVRGKIETISRTAILIRQSGDETTTISPDDIREIRFDREPVPLQIARSNERSGSYRAAVEQLQKVLSEYTGRDQRVSTEIAFLIARCQTRLALVDPKATPTALTSLQTFLQRNSNGYRTLEAMLLQAQLLAGTDRSQAIQLLEQLRRSGVDGFVTQAGVVLGRALLGDDKPDQAREVFDDVIRDSQGKTTALAAHYDSRIGRAECLLMQDQLQEALKDLKDVIDEIPDDQHTALARAWLQTGHCHRRGDQPRAALLAYLHVDLLYSGAAAEHAEALYQLSPLWEAAGHPERASDTQSRLKDLYPHSKWAQPDRQ